MTSLGQEFAVYMDTARMKALFQRSLPDCLLGNWVLTDCHIQHPRFKTYLNPASRHKSYLAVAYHLTGVNSQTNLQDHRILYAKAYLGTRSRAEYLKACSQGRQQQKGVVHIEKYGLVGWFFPHDPELPWLSALLDKAGMRDYLADMLDVGHNPAWGVKDMAFSIVNYRPEIRCTFRYELRTFSGKTALYGKTFSDARGLAIYQRTEHFYQRARQNPDGFLIAQPLRYDAALHTVWLQGLEGCPLIDVVEQENSHHLMAQVARYLVDFQGATMDGLETLSEDGQLAEIQKKCAKLQQAFPNLAQRLEDRVAALGVQKPACPETAYRLVHGDFHIQQLLLRGDGRIALFDFDELARANPLLDVANFCADLYTFNFAHHLTERLIRQLFTAYQTLVETANVTHFEWYLRIQLLTRAYRAYIQQKPNHGSMIKQLLDTSDAGYVDHYTGEFNVQYR